MHTVRASGEPVGGRGEGGGGGGGEGELLRKEIITTDKNPLSSCMLHCMLTVGANFSSVAPSSEEFVVCNEI